MQFGKAWCPSCGEEIMVYVVLNNWMERFRKREDELSTLLKELKEERMSHDQS